MAAKIIELKSFEKKDKTPTSEIFHNKIDSKLLTVDQLASQLSVPKKTIYGWIYRGVLQPIRVGPRLIRFDSEYIARWLLKNGEPNGD
jgi:excisionase family DNA binding protein